MDETLYYKRQCKIRWVDPKLIKIPDIHLTPRVHIKEMDGKPQLFEFSE